ncbi:MAG: sigma-70 family RNA polymerase sigma factor [Sciscionella sp.]
MTSTRPATAEAVDRHDSAAQLEDFRAELTGYCYRMLGSGFEAEDAVQETMVRAWRGIKDFQRRAKLRTWLYRIATNVCIDMLRGPQRRARPMDMSASQTADSALGAELPEQAWLGPIPDVKLPQQSSDPAELAASRDTIRLAFVAALQYLPPRQRAVLVLREVLCWQAAEVAELLETSVASVNSALQRARATLDAVTLDNAEPALDDRDAQRLLEQYVEAFERYDITKLVSLLHEEVRFCMPPYALWLRGPLEVSKWLLGQGIGCRGSRLVATSANGGAAFGSYRPDPDGGHTPFSLIVLEFSGGRIVGWHNFLGPALFTEFGLPTHLEY